MVTGRRVALNALVALVAALATLLPSAPVRADPGCNLGDIFNAGANTVGALTSAACAEASGIGDGTGTALAGGVAFGLGIMQASSGQGSVDSLCNQLNIAQNDVAAIGQWLAAAGISQDVTGEILALGGPALSIIECGCSLEQGVSQLVSDVAACGCDLVNWIPGVNCNNCTPPPPKQANCALPTTCFVGSSDPACQTNNAILGCLTVGGTPVSFGGIPVCPGNEKDGPTGAFVSTQVGDSNCPTLLYCFCPKPLVPTWTSAGPSFGNSVDSGVFTCACPDGTHQAGTAGGIPICLCDYTNQPPKVADTPQGRCPINLLGSCQPNQIVIKGKCVTPCSDPTMGMTPDGACCDPNQVTACGQCCGPGKRPVNGTCVGPGPIQ
jgi:hypothetical protein